MVYAIIKIILKKNNKIFLKRICNHKTFKNVILYACLYNIGVNAGGYLI